MRVLQLSLSYSNSMTRRKTYVLCPASSFTFMTTDLHMHLVFSKYSGRKLTGIKR